MRAGCYNSNYPRLKKFLKCFKVIITAFNLIISIPIMWGYFEGYGIECIFEGLIILIFGLMGTPIFKKKLSKYSFYLKYKWLFSILLYLILLLEVVYIVVLPIE